MRKVSEQTLIKCIVNFKCLGYFGKCFTPFTKREREAIIDELINRGWIDERMNILPNAKDVVLKNLSLCE